MLAVKFITPLGKLLKFYDCFLNRHNDSHVELQSSNRNHHWSVPIEDYLEIDECPEGFSVIHPSP